jgi:hypothetical protein
MLRKLLVVLPLIIDFVNVMIFLWPIQIYMEEACFIYFVDDVLLYYEKFIGNFEVWLITFDNDELGLGFRVHGLGSIMVLLTLGNHVVWS